MKKITNAISLLLTVVVFVSAFGALPVSAETVTAYSSELTALEEALYNGYVNMDATIGISSHGASFNDVQTAFINVLIKRPEIFYVTNRLNVNLTANVVTSVTPVYYCTKDEVATYRAQIDVAVDYIFSDITADMPDVQKLLLLHDRIVSETSYDTTFDTNNMVTNEKSSIHGVFVRKTGIDESYARAFKYCVDKVGIKNEIVYSKTAGHMWNQVCLNNKWYNVDLANDDPISSLTSEDLFAQVKHGRFLISDSKLGSAEYGTDFVSNATTSDQMGTEYDGYFWTNVEGSFIMADGACLYADKYGKIYSYDFSKNEKALITSITDRWSAGNGSNYSIRYVRLMYYNGYVYFNSPKEIYTMRPDGTAKSIIYTYKVDSRQIFGVGYKNGVPSYTLRESLVAKDEIKMISQATKILTAINVTTMPTKTVYNIGEKLDKSGMVVTAVYSDGSKSDLLETDYTVSAFDSSTAGQKNLVVSYGSKTCLLTLTVKAAVGDVDGNTVVDTADLLALEQHMLNLSMLDDQALEKADMNNDGVIDSCDIVILRFEILGL